MCDVLWGVPGCVTKCDREREVRSKLAKNSVTYFMDGPLSEFTKSDPRTSESLIYSILISS